jgi:general secretion pathway protein H
MARLMKPRKSRTGERGFTLLELLVTLTIASLLLAVVAPRLTSAVAHARLRSSGAEIATILRETRSQAMLTSRAIDFSIVPARNGVLAAGKTLLLPSGQTVSWRPATQTDGQALSSLQFQPDGSSSGGVITVADGADQVKISVDWLTGRVSTGD